MKSSVVATAAQRSTDIIVAAPLTRPAFSRSAAEL